MFDSLANRDQERVIGFMLCLRLCGVTSNAHLHDREEIITWFWPLNCNGNTFD